MNLTPIDLEKINDLLGREPSLVEQYIFDTMWSEHCSYKSSKDVLKRLPTKGSGVALGIGEDSGIVRFTHHNGVSYCIAASHESHNHPSQILPVEGAATGVGGVVRDVYCMGADVIGVLDSLHFGINHGNTAPIVEEIAEGVIKGVSDYANALGVPVLGGETIYHESYNENCLVNVAALGLVAESDIIHSYVPDEARTEPYDVILIGKSTDATGFGGASFSSASLDQEDDVTNLGAVQVHDPFLKRVIVEGLKALFQDIKAKQVKVGFKDLGAGGISCATSEIAAGNGFGVHVNLDDVNVISDALPAEVISCSETQERFCLAVPKTYTPFVLDLFNRQFELPNLYPRSGAAVVGVVTTDSRFILRHRGEIVCDLPVSAITTEVREPKTSAAREIQRVVPTDFQLPELSIQEACLSVLSDLNNVSKRHVYRFYDNAVRGDSITYPGETDAMLVQPIPGCNTGLVVTIDSNIYGKVDPYVSGAYAVAESIRNIIAVGGEPLALTDCLNYGNPKKPDCFYDFEQGIQGIADAANQISHIPGEPIPIISGNVSFYNESKKGSAVVPSPVLMCIGRVEDVKKRVGMQVFESGLQLVLVGRRYSEFASTQLDRVISTGSKVAPQVRFDEEKRQNALVRQLIQAGTVMACHDISMGGLFLAVSEMVLGERGLMRVGVAFEADCAQDPNALFSENGGYVLAVQSSDLDSVLAAAQSASVFARRIGESIDRLELDFGSFTITSTQMNAQWQRLNLGSE